VLKDCCEAWNRLHQTWGAGSKVKRVFESQSDYYCNIHARNCGERDIHLAVHCHSVCRTETDGSKVIVNT
jgi:hypothetical protein